MNKKLITLTLAAQNHLKNILKTTGKKAIFFDITSGGCNGFEYRFKPIDNVQNKKNLYVENDLTIEICNKSLLHILGTKIDWNEDIMGENFKFNNPLSKNSCGCGTSFSPF